MDTKVLIAVAGTVLVTVFGGGVIAWVFYWGFHWDYRKKQLQHEERRLMIEKGMTPPPVFASGWPQVKQLEQQLQYDERRLRIEKGLEVPLDLKKPPNPDDYLRRGTILLCLGIGCAIAYFTLQFASISDARDAQAWALGLGPVLGLFGLGHLVYYRLTKGRAADKTGDGRT